MALEHEINAISVTVPDIPTDRLMFEGVNMDAGPFFATSTVSKVFFNRTGYWMRWRERIGSTTLDGVAVEPRRSASHIRQFTLADICASPTPFARRACSTPASSSTHCGLLPRSAASTASSPDH